MRRFLWAAALLCAAWGAFAKDAAEASADPALEKRTLAVAAELRCLVCQNQTIADSNADLAVDLRNQVREMLRKGQSEAEIVAYMTARYGDFVLYRPPVKSSTALLWFGPAALLVTGLTILVLVLRRRSRLPADQFEPDEADDTDPDAPAPEAGRPGKPAP
ncbi:MAG: cytochrome c-type biogenesis protein CcmH [Rubrivivax sp.]|nr:cytochrome c-type biogenesis protein CcmH [Rubrivivax sp.]